MQHRKQRGGRVIQMNNKIAMYTLNNDRKREAKSTSERKNLKCNSTCERKQGRKQETKGTEAGVTKDSDKQNKTKRNITKTFPTLREKKKKKGKENSRKREG